MATPTTLDGTGQLALVSGGAIMPGIDLTRLKSLEVLVPPIHPRCEFAGRVTGVNQLKAAQPVSMAEQDALFATLRHRASSGKL